MVCQGKVPASSGSSRPAGYRVAVEHHGKLHALRCCCSPDVVDVSLERELRRVHADDDQAVVAVLLVPRAHVGQGSQPVDAGVGPEVVDHHLSVQVLRGQWCGVEPSGGSGERRRDAALRHPEVAKDGHGRSPFLRVEYEDV